MSILPIGEDRNRQREGGLVHVLAVRGMRTDVERRAPSIFEPLQLPAALEVRRPMEQQVQTKAPVNRSQSGIVCPRCGRSAARIIGQSESFAVLYLRCEDCRQTSVAPA